MKSEPTKQQSDARNVVNRQRLQQLLDEKLSEMCKRGVFGTIELVISIEDGIIQRDVQTYTKRKHRLG
jgi:hypothetical protein